MLQSRTRCGKRLAIGGVTLSGTQGCKATSVHADQSAANTANATIHARCTGQPLMRRNGKRRATCIISGVARAQGSHFNSMYRNIFSQAWCMPRDCIENTFSEASSTPTAKNSAPIHHPCKARRVEVSMRISLLDVPRVRALLQPVAGALQPAVFRVGRAPAILTAMK